MRKILLILLICSVGVLMMAGAAYTGNFNANLQGDSQVRVHQWLDVVLVERTNLVNIFNYETDYIQSPITNDEMAFIFVYESNAAVNLTVEYSLNPATDLLDVKWSLWRRIGFNWIRHYPALPNWANSGETTQLPHSLALGTEHWLGLSMKFNASKDLPAGTYKITYTLTFTPTVIF